MKKLIIAAATLAACQSAPAPTTTPAPARPAAASGTLTGGADAVGAVRAFMAAAKEQDLQAFGGVWGDASGPARDALPRDELEKRELIMFKCLRNDRYDIAADAPSPGGSRAMVVNLTFKNTSLSTNFEVVRGPANRWYVKAFELAPLQPICMS